MKHVVFLGDGMADEPFAPLGGHTPLELARHPGMDFLASQGEFGLTRTVPPGMPAGSDTANLSVFGYDPKIYYSGRSPLEAASMGIPLAPEDVTYRCNLVTLSDADNIENAVMIDYSADDISNEEAHELIAAIAPLYAAAGCELHAGFRYRHCLVLRAAASGAELTPPHDITGKPVAGHLPKGENRALLLSLMERSREILRKHPVNQKRIEAGLHPANSVWFWGEGRRPALTPFREKFGIARGGVISAVDLVQGIGVCAGLEVIPVAGITAITQTLPPRAARRSRRCGADLIFCTSTWKRRTSAAITARRRRRSGPSSRSTRRSSSRCLNICGKAGKRSPRSACPTTRRRSPSSPTRRRRCRMRSTAAM